MKQILFALIPARGGSKGIKNKNIIDLNGKPLISYTIDQALSSKYIDEVYISSDSNQIKEISQKHGGLVPSLRPKDLAEDDSEMIDLLEYEVVQHEERIGKQIDALVLLQPTSPLRSSADIDNSIKLFMEKKPDAVISVTESIANPYKNILIESDRYYKIFSDSTENITNRQKLKKCYRENGAVYILSRKCIFKYKSVHPIKTLIHEMPAERSIDIDSPFDLSVAEFLLNR